MTLAKSAKSIRRADSLAQVSRVMWRDLDKRIEDVYTRYILEVDDIKTLGNLYLSRSRDYDPIRSSGLLYTEVINSTHISTGRRDLGVFRINEKKELERTFERNAQLWYSQSPSGSLLVFVAPYTSNAGKANESEIIIGKYKLPTSVSHSEIKRHFRIFFKYCSCTSQNNAVSLRNYLYRQWLLFNDLRYKNSFRSQGFRLLERILLLIVGGISVWAILYVDGKI